MLETSIHILNGSAMLDNFLRGGWYGKVFAWEEACIEGPLTGSFDSVFWEHRADYWEEVYGQSHPNWYQDLQDHIQHASMVNLWFEYDLFCQINLQAAIRFVRTVSATVTIHLVQIGLIELGRIRTFGNSELSDWQTCFEQKQTLSEVDDHFSKQFWSALISYDLNSFNEIFKLPESTCFHYLKSAIDQISTLFTHTGTFTHPIELLFTRIKNEGSAKPARIVARLLEELHTVGIGDLQILKLLFDLGLIDDWLNLPEHPIPKLLQGISKASSQIMLNRTLHDHIYNPQAHMIQKISK